jgi:hypothetical protein
VQSVIVHARCARAGRGLALACAVTLALAGLAGCASTGAGGSAPAAAARAEVPQLRLAPAALGRSLALQQRIAVQAPGHAQQLDVLLEADPTHVSLAVLAMGQVAARLDWDGVRLEESRVPWWPPQVAGSRILSDLQLTLWPADAIRAALPAGWALDEEGAVRTLRQGVEPVTTITRRGADTVEITQRRTPYTLTITSRPVEPIAMGEDGAASGGQR